MAQPPNSRDDILERFCELTSASVEEAQECLSVNNWVLADAVEWYYMAEEDRDDEGGSEDEDDENQPPVAPSLTAGGAGRTLDGRPTPPPDRTSTSARNPPRNTNKKFATLGDLNRDQGPSNRGGHAHDDDDDDDDEQDGRPQDFFAGGEKSGLAVQNPADPRRQVKDILKKARNNTREDGEEPSSGPVSRFTGTGQTLGGDDAPSRIIPDPNADAHTPHPRIAPRILHFWQDGFSVEDGPLYRFDDPASAPILALIRAGRAPLGIMGVAADQQVDVTVQEHEEDYVAPKKKYKPFSGGGQRLGSPTPGASSSSSGQAAPSGATQARPSSGSSQQAAKVDIDETQPTVSLQIRLGDGTRLVSRFNMNHTIGDVYGFVNASSPASTQRPWVLMTTFPSKELDDQSVKLGDLSEFKRGGVVVQKWR
ncbi:MAG: hypothetical protein M1816_003724 [Peltula sp. TS41687]|nr:MAG: hypothetical protein M1816_003724 [Peltula sp. TS41687]